MPVETFTREEFEATLPNDKRTGDPLWLPMDLQDGEYVYLVSVTPEVAIEVRSSVGEDGRSRGCGEDSIRCWLVWTDDGQPAGSKVSRWVTRQAGWQGRLTETLRKLWAVGKLLKTCICGGRVGVCRVKKEGPNRGRWFLKCQGCGSFVWVNLPGVRN